MSYIERPKSVSGITERIETGCGHLYVTVNFIDNKVVEVFAGLGKCGGCSKSYA
jgi:ribonucleoside-diphosphate reductase alpha chain